MICPQTKAECVHNCTAWMISCREAVKPPNNYQPKTEFGKKLIDLRAKAVADGMPLEEPPPSLAEIERLVDAYGKQQYELGYAIGSGASFATGAEFERAALMAAIRRLLPVSSSENADTPAPLEPAPTPGCTPKGLADSGQS